MKRGSLGFSGCVCARIYIFCRLMWCGWMYKESGLCVCWVCMTNGSIESDIMTNSWIYDASHLLNWPCVRVRHSKWGFDCSQNCTNLIDTLGRENGLSQWKIREIAFIFSRIHYKWHMFISSLSTTYDWIWVVFSKPITMEIVTKSHPTTRDSYPIYHF